MKENEEKEKDNKKEGMSWLEKLQLALDGAGMVPVYGEVADLANALIYGAQGDWKNAGISLSAMLPIVGSSGTGSRMVYKGVSALQDGLPVVNRTRTAERLNRKGVKYAMPPSVIKPVQVSKAADPTKAAGWWKQTKAFLNSQGKAAGKTINPRNWSTGTKVAISLGAGYGLSEGIYNMYQNRNKGTEDMPTGRTVYDLDGNLRFIPDTALVPKMDSIKKSMGGAVTEPIGGGVARRAAADGTLTSVNEQGIHTFSDSMLPEIDLVAKDPNRVRAMQNKLYESNPLAKNIHSATDTAASNIATAATFHPAVGGTLGAGAKILPKVGTALKYGIKGLFKGKKAMAGYDAAQAVMSHGGAIQHDGGIQKPITKRMSEYIGRSHAEGGIKLQSGGVEVEGGEMEYSDMPMADGSTSDYIFSDKLKYGGKTFADVAKGMAEEGGSEKQIMTLAKMQEAAAKNKGEKGRDPNMIMANGGPVRKNLGNQGIAGMQTGLGGGYFGSEDATMVSEEEERKDFYERNKSLLNELGIMDYKDYDPTKHAEMFQKKVNDHYRKQYDELNSIDKAQLEARGITDAEGYVKDVGFGGEDHKALDFRHGEYHNSITTERPKEEYIKLDPIKPQPLKVEDPAKLSKPIRTNQTVEEFKIPQNTLGNLANSLAVGMALSDKPDYMREARGVTPGIVVAEREGMTNLDRVDYADQLSRNAADAQALNRYIETSGGGSSNISNKMAAFAKKQQGDRKITADETAANIQISNQEAGLNTAAKARNARNALVASQTNARNILAANTANVRNEMYVDEFNRAADAATFDRKLNAVETLAGNINQTYRDRLSYAAQERLAKAVSGNSGVYDRELMQSLLKKLNNDGE